MINEFFILTYNIMKHKVYSIFGAGAAGLYTAWRLLSGETESGSGQSHLGEGDTLELYDWGQYDFSKNNPGTRAAGARVCTWHYKDDKTKSYLELGGMRYSDWNGKDEDGETLSNGVYIYKLIVTSDQGNVTNIGKLAVLK